MTPKKEQSHSMKWRKRVSRVGKALVAFFLLLVLGVYFAFLLPFRGIPFVMPHRGNPPLTPDWALECWLWEDDVNTAEYVWELLDGYAEHDIPVRTILIDSPWSLRYNDFVVDEERYPNSEGVFGRQRGRANDRSEQRGIRIGLQSELVGIPLGLSGVASLGNVASLRPRPDSAHR